MKTTLLHVLFGAERGGCETNSLALIAALQSVRHEVVVLGRDGPMRASWEQAGAHVTVLGENSSGFFRSARAAKGVADKLKPDATIFWHGLIHLPQLIREFNELKIPLIVHGGNPAHTMARRIDWLYCFLSKIHRPRGPLPTYICCSNYVAKSFESSRYLRQFPREVIYNGVKQPSPPLHTTSELTSDNAPVIGMLARLSSIKDHLTLLRAMPSILDAFPNTTLELAGDGDQRGPLEQLASELEISMHVKFLGDVSDVYEHMRRWDLFAYATTEREGLGNALAEAMTFGLPCVVTDVGPMREFAGQDFDCISLVPQCDPESLARVSAQILASRELRERLSANAIKFATERFSPTAYASSHLEVIAEASRRRL